MIFKECWERDENVVGIFRGLAEKPSGAANLSIRSYPRQNDGIKLNLRWILLMMNGWRGGTTESMVKCVNGG